MNALPCDEEMFIADVGRLTNNNRVVEDLRASLASGAHGFQLIPVLMAEVLDGEAWRDRIDRNGNRYTFGPREFQRAITDPPPKGLGTPLDDMRRFLGDSSNPLRVRFEAAIASPAGGLNNPSGFNGKQERDVNHTISMIDISEDHLKTIPFTQPSPAIQGNTVGYAARRLSRERPDLLDRVVAGEMSAHKAMVLGGFRPRSITIPDDPNNAGRRLARHFQGERLAQLIAVLQGLL